LTPAAGSPSATVIPARKRIEDETAHLSKDDV
jgi:hypothetical protein